MTAPPFTNKKSEPKDQAELKQTAEARDQSEPKRKAEPQSQVEPKQEAEFWRIGSATPRYVPAQWLIRDRFGATAPLPSLLKLEENDAARRRCEIAPH
jgi:hypothetical protein